MNHIEILAPAGNMESLIAAVRSGANAIYFGAKSFNARQNAKNFEDHEISDVVSYCHARNVKAYLTLNTLLFDDETPLAASLIKLAASAGIDALIVQDFAAVKIAAQCAKSIPLHASTQMSVHNPAGALELEKLGFSRVVLARELSAKEILEISKATRLELECFVHGALCVCVSGQCYLSSMIGGRSGNRGLCAQPCRLPMKCGGKSHALSLKDLSLVEYINELRSAGVSSLKIEGRMKRPEYVSAAVCACADALNGTKPDMAALKSVFSRDGFTAEYFNGNPRGELFGSRTREDVVAADAALLGKLALKYKEEPQIAAVCFNLSVKADQPAKLAAVDDLDNRAEVSGDYPQVAISAPTTKEKAEASLKKTGGTIFYADKITTDIGDGLMLPASALNKLRRDVLDKLTTIRQTVTPHEYTEDASSFLYPAHRTPSNPGIKIRLSKAGQLSPEFLKFADSIILPIEQLKLVPDEMLSGNRGKFVAELPRVLFGDCGDITRELAAIKQKGITTAAAGGLYSINIAKSQGFEILGDFSLNITNTVSICEYKNIGLSETTISIELTSKKIAGLGGELPRGIIAYGHLPLMLLRACPYGDCDNCENPAITDRLGNKFSLICDKRRPVEVLNCVPLFVGDMLGKFENIDFVTLYFTNESPKRCLEVFNIFMANEKLDCAFTRGLYFRGVL